MGGRIRGLILVVVLVGVGALAGSALSQWWAVPGTTAAVQSVRTVVLPWERVRVEVLNAGGTPNLARTATDELREAGFDVVFFGNADRFGRDSSVVFDRVGRLDPARAVADALGIRTVLSQPDSNLFVDVSVLLGKEWQPLASRTSELGIDGALQPPDAEGSSEPAWWDLRRFLPRGRPSPEGPPEGALADPAGSGDR